jgi:hypothetical protein
MIPKILPRNLVVAYLVCAMLFWYSQPTLSFAQSKEEKAATPPKMKSSMFGRSVLYPEKIIVRPDGAPVYGIEADKMALSVLAIRGTDVVYFQIDILNESEQPFKFNALDFRLLNDHGFRVQGLEPGSVVAMLSAELNIPPPAPRLHRKCHKQRYNQLQLDALTLMAMLARTPHQQPRPLLALILAIRRELRLVRDWPLFSLAALVIERSNSSRN